MFYQGGHFGQVPYKGDPAQSALWPSEEPNETLEDYRTRMGFNRRVWSTTDLCSAWEVSSPDDLLIRMHGSNLYQKVHWKPRYMVSYFDGCGDHMLIYTLSYPDLFDLKLKLSALLLPTILQKVEKIEVNEATYNIEPPPVRKRKR